MRSQMCPSDAGCFVGARRIAVAERLLARAGALLAPLRDRNGHGVLRLARAVAHLAESRASTGNDAAILRERAARAVASLAEDHAAHEIAVPRLLYENARRR